MCIKHKSMKSIYQNCKENNTEAKNFSLARQLQNVSPGQFLRPCQNFGPSQSRSQK